MRTLANERCPRAIPRTHHKALLWPSHSLTILDASPEDISVAKCWPRFSGPSCVSRIRGVVARRTRPTKLSARSIADVHEIRSGFMIGHGCGRVAYDPILCCTWGRVETSKSPARARCCPGRRAAGDIRPAWSKPAVHCITGRR